MASRPAKSANAKVGSGVWRRIPIWLRRWVSGLGPKSRRSFGMNKFPSFELHRAPSPRSRKAWRSFPPLQIPSPDASRSILHSFVRSGLHSLSFLWKDQGLGSPAEGLCPNLRAFQSVLRRSANLECGRAQICHVWP